MIFWCGMLCGCVIGFALGIICMGILNDYENMKIEDKNE